MDNYRAKALGAIGGLLALYAATHRSLSYKSITKHGSELDAPLPETQNQADALNLIKMYLGSHTYQRAKMGSIIQR